VSPRASGLRRALLNRLGREKLQRTAETSIAEGWKLVEVEAEFDYQRAASIKLRRPPSEVGRRRTAIRSRPSLLDDE
jgi:hypothetical protein